MVMMISKFHGLIQSRLLWATFLVVIVFSFVIWGTQMPNQSRKAREAMAAGELNGKLVTQDEFRNAYFNTYMAAVLAVGRGFEINPQLDQQLRDAAWKRLTSLAEAKKLGLTGSDAEVMGTIQRHPGFSENDQFNPNLYAAFAQNVLSRMGFSEAQFEQHVREEIALQKLQTMVQQAILVSPYDVNRTFRSLSDTFDVEYVALTPELIEKDVKVTREDAHKFFLADPAAFTIPEKVGIKYVEFPVTNYLAGITNSEEDALGYYDDHMDEFTITNTVASAEPEEGDTNAPPIETPTSKVTVLSFDLVKTNILERLRIETARNRAADAATDFVVLLAPDREGNAPTFEEAAARTNLVLHTPKPFALDDDVPGVEDAGPLFNHIAFNLTKSPDGYFSDTVPGSNAVYVIAMEERMDARVPEFDEVADEVTVAAKAKATGEALTKKAQDVREAAMKAVDKGASFAKAVQPFGLKPEKTGKFTVASGKLTNEYSEVLLRGILPRNQGEVTDLLPGEDAVLIAYVAGRAAGDSSMLDSLRPQIAESVRRQRTRLLFSDFEEHLLRAGGFEERNKPVVEPEEPEEEGSDTNEPSGDEPLPEEDV